MDDHPTYPTENNQSRSHLLSEMNLKVGGYIERVFVFHEVNLNQQTQQTLHVFFLSPHLAKNHLAAGNLTVCELERSTI